MFTDGLRRYLERDEDDGSLGAPWVASKASNCLWTHPRSISNNILKWTSQYDSSKLILWRLALGGWCVVVATIGTKTASKQEFAHKMVQKDLFLLIVTSHVWRTCSLQRTEQRRIRKNGTRARPRARGKILTRLTQRSDDADICWRCWARFGQVVACCVLACCPLSRTTKAEAHLSFL